MKFCFRCGRPLEDDEDEVCVSCKNPNKTTSFSLRPSSVIWVLTILLLIPLVIYLEISKNYLLCVWLLIPELALFSLSGYFELKFYNSGESKHIQISDSAFKYGVISIIVADIICFGLIIFGIIMLYSM